MTFSIWLWLLVAVGVFWCVGVYNRVMRLKARTLEALNALEKQTRGVVELIRSGLPPEWSALHALARALDEAARNAITPPILKTNLKDFAQAIEALQKQWADTCAVPADLAGAPFPGELQARWDEAAINVQAARNAYNQNSEAYNEALRQFPANVVVGVMGFQSTVTI
jgi:LemA protein